MAYRVSSGMRRNRPGPYAWPAVLVAFVLLVLGLVVAGYWVQFTLAGNMPEGVFTVVDGTYVAVHQVAEYVTALLGIIGGLGVLAGREWGLTTSLVALGALLYTSVNSMASSLLRAPELTTILAGVLVVVVLSILTLHFASRGR